MTGTERMYGIARVLADFYDQCVENGIAITPEVQWKAREVAIAWLQSHPLREPQVTFRLPDEQEQPAAHG